MLRSNPLKKIIDGDFLGFMIEFANSGKDYENLPEVSSKFVTVLGAGVYGFAFEHQEKVYKVSLSGKDKWVLWATKIVQDGSKNPMLPRIEKLVTYKGMAVCRMEKLKSANVSAVVGVDTVLEALSSRWLFGLVKANPSKLRRKAEKYVEEKFYITTDCSYNVHDLADVMLSLKNLVDISGAGLDCHCGNWMSRGNQLVLTDPLA